MKAQLTAKTWHALAGEEGEKVPFVEGDLSKDPDETSSGDGEPVEHISSFLLRNCGVDASQQQKNELLKLYSFSISPYLCVYVG